MPLRTPKQVSTTPPARRVNASAVVMVFVLLFVLAGVGCSNSSRGAKHAGDVRGARDRHVLVISIDGLSAGFLAKELKKGRLPNIARLRSKGSYAERVTGTYPSLIAPGHATIVTGKLPAEHGIYTYASFSQGQGKHRVWTSKDIRVPAVWDKVHQAHLTSAAISWPLANGAPITWNLTGVLDAKKGHDSSLRHLSTWVSSGMIAEAFEGLGDVALGDGTDALRAHLAAGLIKEHKPNLLLLRFPNLHPVQHAHGFASPQAVATLEQVDEHIGDLIAEVKDSGLENTTDVFVISDHGFESYNLEIEPNVLLARAGLLTVNEDGEIIGGKVRTVSNEGSFFIYWPKSEDLRASVTTALRPLREQGLIQSVLDRKDLAKLGADPRVQMALEAHTGTIFEDEATGALTHILKNPRGSDGYLPSQPQMQAVFIAAGPGIRAGVNLHRIQMTSVAPTILKAVGIDDSNFGVHLAIFNPGCCSENNPI